MRNLLQRLNQIKYKNLIWLLAISETIHNIEEAIWLPDWSRTAGVWHPPVGSFQFRFAVAVITLIIYGFIYYYSKHENKPAKYLMGGTLVVILFNVFMPHLIAAIITARYVPGVVTGILLNIPVAFYLLWRGVKEEEYSTRTLVAGSLAAIIIIVPLMLASFAIGRFIGKML